MGAEYSDDEGVRPRGGTRGHSDVAVTESPPHPTRTDGRDVTAAAPHTGSSHGDVANQGRRPRDSPVCRCLHRGRPSRGGPRRRLSPGCHRPRDCTGHQYDRVSRRPRVPRRRPHPGHADDIVARHSPHKPRHPVRAGSRPDADRRCRGHTEATGRPTTCAQHWRKRLWSNRPGKRPTDGQRPAGTRRPAGHTHGGTYAFSRC